mgnify:CR=1 FL=1
MNIGNIVIIIAFITAIGAGILYLIEEKKNKLLQRSQELRSLSDRFFSISLLTGLIASAILFYSLISHQFQYSYVAHYSSRDLPLFYLISSFWAGQEGTFLLWAILVGIMGLKFRRTLNYSDKFAMAIVSFFMGLLYLILMSKSPFEILTPTPPDGSGLNPLLQDPWMVIHPPILFIGYAATTFPFALAVSGLRRKNYSNWHKHGLPWSLFAAVALGAGIIIGGFWAYEVLGWGGYWGWDPVENSSLVPWITLLALIHGLIIHKAKGSLQRTNLFLALLTFNLVIYATFLTRSGILSNFSVHSFGDLGINNYLIAMMILSTGVGFGLFFMRMRDLNSPRIDTGSLNREVMLFTSMYVLLASALFIFIGMSSPILTGLMGTASQVDISFYNKVNLPVGIAMALLLGITPFLGWTEDKKEKLFRRYSISIFLAILSCAIAFVAGVTSWLLIIFIGSSVFGLISNIIVTFRQYRSGWLNTGGPISHIGVALLLIGIIGSGNFDESKQIILKQNEPQQIFGYDFTFLGTGDPNDLKTLMKIKVYDGKTSFIATPKLYFSDYNQAMMREPDIKVMPLKDLYISPLELQRSNPMHAHNPMYSITKGETKDLHGYHITFDRFEVGEHGTKATMAVGAVLTVEIKGKKYELMPILTINEKGERAPVPIDLPSPDVYDAVSQKKQLLLNGLNVEEDRIIIEFTGFDQHKEEELTHSLVVDISIKPLMMVVWTGVILIIAGTLIAWRRRLLQKT